MIKIIEYYIGKIIKKLHFRCIKNSYIDKSSSIGAESSIIDVNMDKYSFCGYNCRILETNIGKFCSIASNCEIGGANHTIDWISTSPVFNKNKEQIKTKFSYHNFNPFDKQVNIGNDVWIGSCVIIKSGVTIGDGAIIGAGSVVTKDVPSYEIWAGNPAKFIRLRFELKIIKKLLEDKWWNYSDENLKRISKYINNIDKFIEEIDKIKGEK